MARSRNLKPGFFTNEELAKCAHGARLLFEGLWILADRDGRLKDSPDWIKAHTFPFERAPIEKWLQELAGRGFIIRYESGGRRYIQVVNFLKHQKPHIKESESTIPAPTQGQCAGQCDVSAEPGSSTYIDRGIQHSGIKEEAIRNQESGRGREAFEPPTVDEVRTYCELRKNHVDANAFVDFYVSKGWKVGNQAMKDWQAAVRTWERYQRSNGKSADDPRGNISTLNRYLKESGDGE